MESMERKNIDYLLSYIARLLYFITLMLIIFQLFKLARDGNWPTQDILWIFSVFEIEPFYSSWNALNDYLKTIYTFPLSAFTFGCGLFFTLLARRV